MAEQQCLVIIKPDGLVKSLTGNIITELSETKLKIVGAKVISVKRELAEKHYAHLKDKFLKLNLNPQLFEDTIAYFMGEFHTNRVFAMVYHGENAIEKVKEIVGATNPEEARHISIRGKYGRIHSKTGVYENVIHCSDCEESAKKEIQLWFSPEELVETIYPVKKENVQAERLLWQ